MQGTYSMVLWTCSWLAGDRVTWICTDTMTTQMMCVIENKGIFAVPKNEGDHAEKEGKWNDFID